MSGFEERLKETRIRAGLSQLELAEKVEVDKSYISKLERGVESPPSRKVAVKLADAVGMSNKPVTLYVSTKDRAALERFVFLLEANVVGAEDVQAIGLINVEDSEDEEEEGQAVSPALPGLSHPVLALSDSVLDDAFDQITDIFESKQLSKEQMRRAASELIESANQIARLIKQNPISERKVRP
jgi:transcriptional regulator with XRE-family HTH domain